MAVLQLKLIVSLNKKSDGGSYFMQRGNIVASQRI